MRKLISLFLMVLVFLGSFQNAAILIDYHYNKDYYEKHCVNKDKPELSCHGKCQVKKETENATSSGSQLIKMGFEFNLMINKKTEIPKITTLLFETRNSIFFSNVNYTFRGYYLILPHPPQFLV